MKTVERNFTPFGYSTLWLIQVQNYQKIVLEREGERK